MHIVKSGHAAAGINRCRNIICDIGHEWIYVRITKVIVKGGQMN